MKKLVRTSSFVANTYPSPTANAAAAAANATIGADAVAIAPPAPKIPPSPNIPVNGANNSEIPPKPVFNAIKEFPNAAIPVTTDAIAPSAVKDTPIMPNAYPIFSAVSGLIAFNADAIPFNAFGTTALMKSAPIESRSPKNLISPVPTLSANGSSACQKFRSASLIAGKSIFMRNALILSTSIGSPVPNVHLPNGIRNSE